MGIMAYTKRGIAPADPTTDVGKFRFGAGDSEYQPTEPPEEGFGLYQLWSDADIVGLLALAGGSVARAVAIAYGQIGASYASTGGTIKTDDLSVSAKDAVTNWLALAKFWNDIADSEAGDAVDDYFDLVEVRGESILRKPEGSPWPFDYPRGFLW